ncbi:MAG: bspRIM [Sphingobacteriaceae bacterium]|nr:bspRIM [Sphingobacteriaceae bacterium]
MKAQAQTPVPIIDLFAGPGGLAEGFSSVTDRNHQRAFNIKLSIEKDPHAHQTLTLRSFLRQFPLHKFPEEYYQFIRGELSLSQLYQRYPAQHATASHEAWQATLGVTPEAEIDKRIKDALTGYKNWVLIGGPPCQAYSLAGRSRVGGIHAEDHRVHLYKEYLRIIAAHQPAVFVMENVKGLLSAKLNEESIFPRILDDLKNPTTVFPKFESAKYKIFSLVSQSVKKDSDYLIKAEQYGVPQRRHRVILLGIRQDINEIPGTLTTSNMVPLQSVIGQFPQVRSGLYRSFDRSEIQTINGVGKKKRYYNNIKDSFSKWEEIVTAFSRELLVQMEMPETKMDLPSTIGEEFKAFEISTISADHPLKEWYTDNRLGGILHHVSRGHLTQDLKRYLFASLYAKKFKKFPRMVDYKLYGRDLLPDHENAESGKFNDRFRVQLPDEPATTITSHISKDGHYFIHYDPTQARSLTVREAARIQTFPDNYYFCGSRTQQFHQVGNAVPPYLAFKISKIVLNLLSPSGND